MTDTQVYVACLASRNNGDDHGQWIDTDSVDQMVQDIEDMLKESPVPNAEEWEILDTDGFEDLWVGDRSLETIASIAELIEEHGTAFIDYYKNENNDLDYAAATFEDAYAGQYDSLEDYAQEQFDELYGEFRIPGFRIEVDLTFWRCDYWISDNGHVFRSV